jgi:hypothetical protein
MKRLDAPPLRKLSSQALGGEPGSGDADQKSVAGVPGKVFGSIKGAVVCK